MKGLILKDLYGCRFQIIGALLIMMLPMLMVCLAGGGMAVDNSREDSLLDLISFLLFGTANYVSIVICSSFYLNTLKYDETCGWTKMQRTMPLSGGQIVGGKLIGAAIIVGILTAMSVGFNAICAFVFEISLEPIIVMPVSLGLLEAVIMLPSIVVGYRFGAKSVNAVYISLLTVISVVTIAVVAMFMCKDIGIEVMRIIVYAIIPAITAAVAFICVKTGKRAVAVDI